jgi:hypothetical protein
MTNEDYLDWQLSRRALLPAYSSDLVARHKSSVCSCCATMCYSFLPTLAYDRHTTKEVVLTEMVRRNMAMVSIQDSNSPLHPKLYTDKKSVHLTIKDGNNITTMEWPIL